MGNIMNCLISAVRRALQSHSFWMKPQIRRAMNIIQRAKSPTPKFFKALRNVGLILLGVSGTIMSAPVVLPAALVGAAGYAAVAGGVITAVRQVTVEDSAKKTEDPPIRNPHGFDPDITG